VSNTFVRTLIAILFIPIILGVCVGGKFFFLGFTLIIGTLAFYEFISMANKKDVSGSLIIGIPAVVTIVLNAYFNFVEFSSLIFFIVFIVLLHELFRNKKSAILNLGVTFLGILYIGVFVSAFILLREYFDDYQHDGNNFDACNYLDLRLCCLLFRIVFRKA